MVDKNIERAIMLIERSKQESNKKRSQTVKIKWSLFYAFVSALNAGVVMEKVLHGTTVSQSMASICICTGVSVFFALWAIIDAIDHARAQ